MNIPGRLFKELWTGWSFGDRRKPVRGGCEKNVLFFTLPKIPSRPDLSLFARSLVNHAD